MPVSAIVCRCAGVSRGQIERALAAGCSAAEVGPRTGAGEVCGSCRPSLAQLTGRVAAPRPRAGLLAISAAAAAACGALALAPPAIARSARSLADAAIAAGATRLVTGFSLLTLCAFAMALPLAKRVLAGRGARIAGHRVLHAAIGLMAAGLAAVHTGMHLGSNLNRALMIAFIALLGTGAALAALTGIPPRRRRSLVRPVVAIAHIVVLWVLPALLGFHVFTAFYF